MAPSSAPERTLAADCASCSGLCCVALAFARSADFAFDKPAGEECVNLDDGFGCRIHPQLRERGFKGCTVFDCFGAGQLVTRHTFDGRSWRDNAGVRTEMFAVFPIVRQLHELLWYLREAIAMPAAASIRATLRASWDAVTSAADAEPALILALDVDELRAPAAALLREAARLTREAATAEPTGGTHTPLRIKRSRLAPGADLLGADLRGADLRGAELRGALLIGADLRSADLTAAELIGADLRDARLDGADLHRAIYLTQPQVDAARGDETTRLPAALMRPSHWHHPSR
ncbi:pentapeptide repeat-containing protein [Leifsonia shinshuensis]|uniref:Pentapeptide repeat-containing protein n=1 Tax=Leifsonia shinshuensis TaxID=150026 RepID=A0A7G6YAW0_9MICO|nr:pentapeptide repeat-containing protein [Leifsonia shinshuensis]QNE35625.1 pentapeptide repeat-containing protein [Leifsonia shinshuensis]